MKKVDYPIDKNQWQPSLIPGAIVLISTHDSREQPNVAPKSWLQMVSFEPPMLMFSGSKRGTTERNIIETGCFGVNIVDSSMASRVYGCVQWSGQERIDRSGFIITDASKINAPLVGDCRAHLECELHSTKEVGSGFVAFGEILAASIWEEILAALPDKRYELLDQIIFLEKGVFSKVGSGLRVT
jgi:flavin reductase (DIM6/NTAB) family NADH-FMN oxidoreductase RutF